MDEKILGQDKIYEVRNKTRQRREQLVEYIGDLLIPQTEGYDHVNMDMTFTYLGNWDLAFVDNYSVIIIMSQIYELKKAQYLARGTLATFLNSRRSRNAKSMDIFTTMMTKQEQTFVDKTDSKNRFSWLGFGKKKEGK